MFIETPRQVGLVVSAARQDLGLTQERVAREAGVSRQLVNKLEMGLATGISLTKLLAILSVCGCTLTIDREGGKEPSRPAESEGTTLRPAANDCDPSELYPLDLSLFTNTESEGDES